jgi:hypothetical protein
MAAPNDTEEERRVGGGKGLFCFLVRRPSWIYRTLSPSSQKNPFLEGNSKIKRLNDGKTLTGEKETNK